ncbi:MAG: Uma2 family endonuclease [Planctomycetaceae bacterium]|nr:Uma2 family endonuclease [Planctomycetaceae bacterium]
MSAGSPSPTLTAEEFFADESSGAWSELVRGRVVTLCPPGAQHGAICTNVVYELMSFLEEHALGRGICNNCGVITERDPDTVRGPDIAYYSFDRIPPGPAPTGYPTVSPDLIFEVLSTNDSTREMTVKVGEYLATGVRAVVLVNPERSTVTIYRPDDERPVTMLRGEETFSVPEILPGWELPVSRFFE